MKDGFRGETEEFIEHDYSTPNTKNINTTP